MVFVQSNSNKWPHAKVKVGLPCNSVKGCWLQLSKRPDRAHILLTLTLQVVVDQLSSVLWKIPAAFFE